MKIITRQDIEKSFQLLKILNEYLPNEFPDVELKKYRLDYYDLIIGDNEFSFTSEKGNNSFELFPQDETIIPKYLSLLYFVFSYEGEPKFVYTDSGALPLEFKPKYFVDYYLGLIRSKKRMRNILEHMLIPKKKIDEILKSRETDKHKINRQQRRYMPKDPEKVLKIISTFREFLPSMFQDEKTDDEVFDEAIDIKVIKYKWEYTVSKNKKNKWEEIVRKNKWGATYDNKYIGLRRIKKAIVTINHQNKSLIFRTPQIDNLDITFSLLVNFAQRYKCEPNHLIVVDGIPHKFKYKTFLEHFLEQYDTKLDSKQLRKIMVALGCKKRRIDNTIYKYKHLLHNPWYPM